jgi:hypothetical protein
LELEQLPQIPKLVRDKQVFESTEGISGVEDEYFIHRKIRLKAIRIMIRRKKRLEF